MSHTENFRIARVENGLIKATGTGCEPERNAVTSALTFDSLGTAVKYDVTVTEKGVKTATVSAERGVARLTARSSDQRGDESMREYPLTPASRLLLDERICPSALLPSPSDVSLEPSR